MSERPDDFELLRDYARRGKQAAFATVVRRHLDLVYGTALRKVEEPGAAQEIAQNVFAALGRKAWQFGPDDSLPAWLYRTTLLEAKSWWRGELRRRRREQTAAELGTTMKTPDEQPALHGLLPLLDEGLLCLREKERSALLLRFYENRPLRDVGAALGVSEDAARKRVASALERLVQFFQRRGFKAATSAAIVAALQHTALSAPAAVATAVVNAALQAGAPTLAGAGPLLARFASLTKAQTVAACLLVAAAPVGWRWSNHLAVQRETASLQAQLETTLAGQQAVSAQLDRLRAQSARLDARLNDTAVTRARDEAAAVRLAALKGRVHGLLTNDNYHWPEDLPYIRIPKAVIKDLDVQAMFSSSGVLSEPAQELLQVGAAEQLQAAQALGNYWRGVENLEAARAYETNLPAAQPGGRLCKTVIIPPLGQELKTLAEGTRAQLSACLGTEREKILFGGWDQGAIQLFWPGNLWNIAEHPQTLTVWVDPAGRDGNGPRYGASRSTTLGGTSGEGGWALGLLPEPIAARFFRPWLEQFGITDSTSHE